jgi:hypothetical protein
MALPDPASWFVIEQGWKVLDADGTEVGKVEETLGDKELDIFDGLTVSTGLLSRAAYVPSEHVGEIRDGQVQLSLSSDEVAALKSPE